VHKFLRSDEFELTRLPKQLQQAELVRER